MNLITGQVSSGNLGAGMAWVIPPYTPQGSSPGSCTTRGVLKLTFNQSDRKRAEITMALTNPKDWTFNIGDSETNNGYAGDGGSQAHDAEMHNINDNIYFYGSDKSYGLSWGQIFLRSGVVKTDNLTINVQDELGTVFNGAFYAYINTMKMFALNSQPDFEGPVNNDIYFGINRVVSGDYRSGSGLCGFQVKFHATTI